MAKHVHAENMALYAQDALTSDKPYLGWQYSSPYSGTSWVDCSDHPQWGISSNYRRKPKLVTVTLPSKEVVTWKEPEREPLPKGTAYYIADVSGVTHAQWTNSCSDKLKLSLGCVFVDIWAAEHFSSVLKTIHSLKAEDVQD